MLRLAVKLHKGFAMAAYLPYLVFASASEESLYCCNLSLLPSKQFVVLQIFCLLSMDCTPRMPTKHVVKKIRSLIVL